MSTKRTDTKAYAYRQAQREENEIVLKAIDDFNAKDHKYVDSHRLRSCSAWVYEYEDCRVLVSYNTIIAHIDLATGIMYDYLRYVYGYTSTSSQHLSKFQHDCGAQRRFTYRYVGEE